MSIQLSSRILLLECQSNIVLFGIKQDRKSLITNIGFFFYNKTNPTAMVGNQIKRCASVYNQIVAYYNGTAIIIKNFNMNDSYYGLVINNFTVPLSGVDNLFNIFMSRDYILWAKDKNNSYVEYIYLPCVFQGFNQTGNSCSSSSIISIYVGINVTQNFRIKQANSSD